MRRRRREPDPESHYRGYGEPKDRLHPRALRRWVPVYISRQPEAAGLLLAWRRARRGLVLTSPAFDPHVSVYWRPTGVSIVVMVDGRFIDMLFDIDLYIEKAGPRRFFCRFCEAPTIFSSKRRLMVDHLIAPIAKRISNGQLTGAIGWDESDLGSTWAWFVKDPRGLPAKSG